MSGPRLGHCPILGDRGITNCTCSLSGSTSTMQCLCCHVAILTRYTGKLGFFKQLNSGKYACLLVWNVIEDLTRLCCYVFGWSSRFLNLNEACLVQLYQSDLGLIQLWKYYLWEVSWGSRSFKITLLSTSPTDPVQQRRVQRRAVHAQGLLRGVGGVRAELSAIVRARQVVEREATPPEPLDEEGLRPGLQGLPVSQGSRLDRAKARL